VSPTVVRSERPGDPLTAYSIKAPNEPIGTIGIPVRDHLNAATVTSIMTSLLAPGWNRMVDFNIIQGSVLASQRNELVQRMRGEWLLFIDDDMVWQPGQLLSLIETRDKFDLDMVGALCFRRSDPFQPTLYMREAPTSGAYNFLEAWPENEAIEVDATGLACVVIHRRVFERIVESYDELPGWTFPPYEARVGQAPPNFFRWEGTYGEDLRFCQDAKTTGSRIFVDTGIEIGHVGEVAIGRKHFLLALAGRDDDLIEARRKINDTMGLPTVSRAEAREKLGWS
jgi:Glycosyl transferase family 2